MTDHDHSLTSAKHESRVVEPFLNPLPRAVTRNNEFRLLDGEWRFSLDLEDRGLAERWFDGHRYESDAHWPGSIESHFAAAHDAKALGAKALGANARGALPWEDDVVAWYERDVAVPESWLTDGAVPQITFGACGYETRVWLDGHLLATVEGEEVHYGETTSFSYEIPPELVRPINRLTVRVADSLDDEIPRGKQQSRVYKRGGIWYQTISGPVRSVWIEPVDRNRLRSRVTALPNVEDGAVGFRLTTRVHDPGAYRVRLAVSRRGGGAPVSVEEYPLELEAGTRGQWFMARVADPLLWSPDAPNLYQMAAQLVAPTGHVAQIEASFGLRKIEARGRRLFLNNEPIYLDGILYQPADATFEQMRSHMLAIKRLGCNLARVHIAGLDPRAYDVADEIGLLLWIEVPSPHRSTERSRANHWAELQRMLVHAGSHPSVAIVSLYNEDWGVEDIATSAATRAYVADTYRFMRFEYPHLLTVDNDGWQHVSVEGRLMSRLLTAHLYTPDVETWRAQLDEIVAGRAGSVAGRPVAVGDPFFYRGQMPIVVSEWGGFGFPDYGGPKDLTVRDDRIAEFKRELRTREIAGDVYTQATNVEDERNGLVDAETGELLVGPGLLGPPKRGEGTNLATVPRSY